MRYGHKHGFFELNPFPGSNQVVVSNHALIFPQYRNKGFGQIAHERRLEEARKLGYDHIICTVRADNAAQIHILEKNGWKKYDSFKNKETDHDVELWGKSL